MSDDNKATTPHAAAPSRRRKLPARFPRREKILLFNHMYELDLVLSSTTLSAYSAVMMPHRWKEAMEGFDTLRDRLIEAYAEYEAFWKRANWRADEDIGFMARVRDHGSVRNSVCERSVKNH